MRVRLSSNALIDIRAIAEFISDRNPDRAVGFADELLDACAEIGQHPLAYPSRPHWGRGVRARFYGQYAIIFVAKSAVVSILRVVHAARNLDAVIGDEPSVD